MRPALIAAGFAAFAAGPALAQPPPPGEPVYLEETGKDPGPPPSASDLDYEKRIRSSMASALAFQGPLAGGWTLAAGDSELYAFQFVDRGGGVEGAWRDLRRKGAPTASGLIDAAARTDAGLMLRFADGAVATLRPAGDGHWTGDLVEAGRTETVSLQRRPSSPP